MHEDNLPVARLLLEESRFQPLQLRGAGSVGNTAFVDVGDPSGVVADVHVGFGHIPLVMFAGGVLGFDKGHNSVSVEAEAAIEDVKAWSNVGVQHLRDATNIPPRIVFAPDRLAQCHCGLNCGGRLESEKISCYGAAIIIENDSKPRPLRRASISDK